MWLSMKDLGLAMLPFTHGAILVHLFEPQPLVLA